MANYTSIAQVMSVISGKIKEIPQDLTTEATYIAKVSKDRGASGGVGVPFRSGTLGSSPFTQPSQLRHGLVIWGTNYAREVHDYRAKNKNQLNWSNKIAEQESNNVAKLTDKRLNDKMKGV